MCYNHVISVHCLVCAHACVCVWVRACVGACVCAFFCSFVFGLHCYWLDCSHPPIHPIATIATDGAAGINAPGSASLINGRLTKPLISDLFCRDFFLLHSPPIMGAAHLLLCSTFPLPFVSMLSMHVLL